MPDSEYNDCCWFYKIFREVYRNLAFTVHSRMNKLFDSATIFILMSTFDPLGHNLINTKVLLCFTDSFVSIHFKGGLRMFWEMGPALILEPRFNYSIAFSTRNIRFDPRSSRTIELLHLVSSSVPENHMKHQLLISIVGLVHLFTVLSPLQSFFKTITIIITKPGLHNYIDCSFDIVDSCVRLQLIRKRMSSTWE